MNIGRLIRLRNKILVNMDFKRQTVSHHEDIYVKYNIEDIKMSEKPDGTRLKKNQLSMLLVCAMYGEKL